MATRRTPETETAPESLDEAVEAEPTTEEPVEESIEPPVPKEPEPEPVAPPAPPMCDQGCKDFWTGLGLPYCDQCCSPRRTDQYGNTVCVLSLPIEQCPLLSAK
jgi:hypothetical protein